LRTTGMPRSSCSLATAGSVLTVPLPAADVLPSPPLV